MYDPTTIQGMAEAMATEMPFLHYVKHCISQHKPYIPENPRILDVGCGWCPGGKNIASFFNGSLTGIDINEKDIMSAKTDNAGSNIEFIVGDASRIKELAPGPYDVLIVRNMFPSFEFADALKHCRHESSDSAVIFATFYSRWDFEFGKMSISDAGFAVKDSGINPYYLSSLVESGFSMDNDLFGLFGIAVPTNPSIFRRIAKFLGL